MTSLPVLRMGFLPEPLGSMYQTRTMTSFQSHMNVQSASPIVIYKKMIYILLAMDVSSHCFKTCGEPRNESLLSGFENIISLLMQSPLIQL